MQELRQKESKMEQEILKAVRKAFYEGERILIRTEEMEVGLVPPEDVGILEELDAPIGEKEFHTVS